MPVKGGREGSTVVNFRLSAEKRARLGIVAGRSGKPIGTFLSDWVDKRLDEVEAACPHPRGGVRCSQCGILMEEVRNGTAR